MGVDFFHLFWYLAYPVRVFLTLFYYAGRETRKRKNQHSIFKILHSLTHFSKFVSSFFSLRRRVGCKVV